MDEENSLLLFLDIKAPKTQSKLPYKSEEEPFQIVYNARASENTKSRKASYCKISEPPQKLKKPRKMTLPIEATTSYQISQNFLFETYSDRNYPLTTHALPHQPNESQDDLAEMDLEKGIQCAIAEESELDKESWFGIKSQNPEFGVME